MKTNLTPDRKKLTSEEYDAMLALEAAHAVLKSKGTWPALEQRVKAVKYGKRDQALINNALRRLMTAMYNDVPFEQLKTLSNNLKLSELRVGVKTVQKHSQRDYGIILSWEQYNTLGAAAMEKCVVCTLNPQEQRKCPLKKVLDELPERKNNNSNGCGYFGL